MNISEPRLPAFSVLVAASCAEDHRAMIRSATPFFNQMAAEHGFTVDFTQDTDTITETALAQYQVFVMLQLAPFEMSPAQQAAVQAFIESGKGWVGIHAAGLTGCEFMGPETPYWQWYEDFLGGVVYSPHPAYQTGTVRLEDTQHPATRNLPAQFEVADEWYEFNRSPRARVHVLATADESTYTPNQAMGDHPIFWTNETYGRAIYLGIGHHPSLLTNPHYAVLLRDSLLWAASVR